MCSVKDSKASWPCCQRSKISPRCRHHCAGQRVSVPPGPLNPVPLSDQKLTRGVGAGYFFLPLLVPDPCAAFKKNRFFFFVFIESFGGLFIFVTEIHFRFFYVPHARSTITKKRKKLPPSLKNNYNNPCEYQIIRWIID